MDADADPNAVSIYIIDSNYLASQYIYSLLIDEPGIRLAVIDISSLEHSRAVDSSRCLLIVDQRSVESALMSYGQRLQTGFPASGLIIVGERNFTSRMQRIFQPWVQAAVEYAHVSDLRNVVSDLARSFSVPHASSKPLPKPFLLQHSGLSKRELEIFDLLTLRLSNKEIASLLDVTVATVKFHISNIFTKMNVRSRQELLSKIDSLKSRGGSKECASSSPSIDNFLTVC